MVIGNPDIFSIMVDVVNEWNYDKSFNNGLLFMGINGTLFMSKITSATLNTEIYALLKNLKNPKINEEIFKMKKEEAFRHIYKITIPDNYNLDNDYSYDITPYEFSDNNCLIFMVSNGKKFRILASELEYDVENHRRILHNINVVEVYISYEQLNNIIDKLDKFNDEIRIDIET